MRTKQVVLLAVLGLLAVLVAWLALRNPKPPWIPPDAEHAHFESSEACLTCHGPTGAAPQSANHPLGLDCLRCHAFR